ncbi:MAG: CPBP family intramembrane metalloprotease, partial [Dehalococcoidia bacterium]|nr:CPBP family intramembrane metalloprotease [Dehalococcoidia bacterium]
FATSSAAMVGRSGLLIVSAARAIRYTAVRRRRTAAERDGVDRKGEGMSALTVSEPARPPVGRVAFGFVAAVWALGLAGRFLPFGEWPALALYVIGGLAIPIVVFVRRGAGATIFLTRTNGRAAIGWGVGLGLLLCVVDVVNTYVYYANGGAPMVQMQAYLFNVGLIAAAPLLLIAEEFVWRGFVFRAMRDHGYSPPFVVVGTTLLYALNHYAVAPVGMFERTALALMAIPIGLAAGAAVARTKNVWAGVIAHGLTYVSMLIDVFVIPPMLGLSLFN